MAGTTLRSVLAGRNLCGTIQSIKPGLPDDAMPPALMNQTSRKITGNTGTYYQVEGSRKTATLVQYGAPSVRRALSGVAEKPFTLAHFAENIEIPAADLENLESDTGEKQALGEQEVMRRLEETRTILDNGRAAMVMSAICLGAIYYGASGNLLPSSSGAKVSIDYGVPAGNKSQLNIDGSGSVIAASWATAGTSILKHVQNLKSKARKKNGYKLKHAVYGANILDYFTANTTLKEYLVRNPRYNDAFSNGEIADGFLGFTWWPGYEAFFQDKDGTNQDLLGADQIAFFPEVDATWYERVEGTNTVPRDMNVSADVSAALKNTMQATGMFAYAELKTDPVCAKMVYGDTYLPLIKVPGALYIATVAGF